MAEREIAQVIGTLLQEKNEIKPQLGTEPEILTFIRNRIERLSLLQVDAKLETRDTSADQIWSQSTWSGTVWDGTYTEEFVIVMCRRYTWRTTPELEQGTKDTNISISEGQIKLI